MFNMLEMKRQAEIQLVCIIFFATMACSAAVRADKFPCVNNCQCYSSFSTTGDRASLHVDCRGTGITAVSSQNFMRHAWEAVSLDLGSNLISNLPAHSFSLQTHLRTLNLESNDIETVDQACFNVSSNLEHSTTSPLELINLKDNRLLEVPVCFGRKDRFISNLGNLETLLLGGNPLGKNVASNSFDGVPNLIQLDLSRTEMDRLPDSAFRKNPRLKVVDFSSNCMSNIPRAFFPRNSALRTIRLDGNLFENIPSNLPAHLKDLRLAANLLQNITCDDIRSLALLTDLEILDLSGNNIAILLSGTFKAMSRLRYLDLSKNKLELLLPRTFYGLANLEVLLLNDNKALSSVSDGSFANLSNLKYLFLYGCSLAGIRSKARSGRSKLNDYLPTLRYMWLFGNPLNCDCELIPLLQFVNERHVRLDEGFHSISLPDETLLHDAIEDALSRTRVKSDQSVCVSPHNRYKAVVGHAILDVSKENLSCPDEPMYIVVSSFLGIALFTIAVPIVYCLVGVYLFLIGIAKKHFGWKMDDDNN